MSDNKKIILTIIILLLFLVASLFFCFHYNIWIGLCPLEGILLAEYISQVRRHKTFKIPVIVKVQKWVMAHKKKPHSELSTVADQMPPVQSNLPDSISKVLLKDWIQIDAYKNYDLLGTGTQAEKEACVLMLFSQLQQATDEEDANEDLKIKNQILALDVRRQAIQFNIAILKERYSKEAVRGLQHYFKDHYGKPIYSFSVKTMQDDIKKVIISEKATERKRKELITYSEDLRKGKKSATTPEDQENNYIDTIIWIKEVLKITFDENTVNLLMYARMKNKAYKTIKHQQEQELKNKRGR